MAEQNTTEWQAIADSAAKSIDTWRKCNPLSSKWLLQNIARCLVKARGWLARDQRQPFLLVGDMPLVVLASSKPNPAFGEVAEEYQRYWVEQSRILSDKPTIGKLILAEAASHHLYLDAPELVAESILSVIYEVRAK